MNVTEVCRLCLSDLQDETQSLLDPPYWMMLSTLAAIQVNDDSPLSTVSCTQCLKDLEFSYTFRQNAIKCDQILRQQVINAAPQIKIKEVCEEEPQVESFSEILKEEGPHLYKVDTKTEECETDDTDDEVDNPDAGDCSNRSVIKTERAPTPIVEGNRSAMLETTEKRKCSICLRDVSCHEVKAHIMMHFKKEQTCLDCNSMVGDVKAYQKHIEENHNHVANTESQCSQCPLSFKYKAFYYAHIKAHYEMMVPRTVKTNQKTRKPTLTARMTPRDRKRWHNSRMMSCSVCFAKVTAYNMHSHMKIHTTGPQICELCGSVLRNETSLRAHLAHTHSTKRLRCDQCGRIFKEKSQLNLHKKKHNNDKDHICELCGKKFFTQHTVNQHVRRVHMRLRPHNCNFCTKGFYSFYGLKTHMRQHTNETPYKCELCGEAFKQRVSLRTHKKSKHKICEEDTVACKECGKKFSTEHALTSHMRIHN